MNHFIVPVMAIAILAGVSTRAIAHAFLDNATPESWFGGDGGAEGYSYPIHAAG